MPKSQKYFRIIVKKMHWLLKNNEIFLKKKQKKILIDIYFNKKVV